MHIAVSIDKVEKTLRDLNQHNNPDNADYAANSDYHDREAARILHSVARQIIPDKYVAGPEEVKADIERQKKEHPSQLVELKARNDVNVAHLRETTVEELEDMGMNSDWAQEFWSKVVPVSARQRFLKILKQEMAKYPELLKYTIQTDVRKSASVATGELDKGYQYMDEAASVEAGTALRNMAVKNENLDAKNGRTGDAESARVARVGMVPLKRFGIITSFNYPLALTLAGFCRAILTGNSVFFKPSQRGAQWAFVFQSIFKNAMAKWAVEEKRMMMALDSGAQNKDMFNRYVEKAIENEVQKEIKKQEQAFKKQQGDPKAILPDDKKTAIREEMVSGLRETMPEKVRAKLQKNSKWLVNAIAKGKITDGKKRIMDEEIKTKDKVSITDPHFLDSLSDGMFNIVIGYKAKIHTFCDNTLFIGSAKKGLQLAAEAAEAGKNMTLDLGGLNPIIVDPSYFEGATLADKIAKAEKFAQDFKKAFAAATGQRCTKNGKMDICWLGELETDDERAIYDAFLKELYNGKDGWKIGSNYSDASAKVDQGPMVGEKDAILGSEHIMRCMKMGATIHILDPFVTQLEGDQTSLTIDEHMNNAESLLRDNIRKGDHLSRAIIEWTPEQVKDATPDHPSQCEIFAPFTNVIRGRTPEQASVSAAETKYKLQACLFCAEKMENLDEKTVERLQAVMQNLEKAGITVHINTWGKDMTPDFAHGGLPPFGGNSKAHGGGEGEGFGTHLRPGTKTAPRSTASLVIDPLQEAIYDVGRVNDPSELALAF